MARPLKTGLDYFPLDTDFFSDDKIQFVAAKYEEKGEMLAIKLLCKIYKNGYMIPWNGDMALLFARSAGRNISIELVNGVIVELLKRDFFDKNLFEQYSILTSRGIQKRYLNICESAKRKNFQIPEKYLLIELTPEETRLTPEETQLTPEESTQSKGKEIKEEDSLYRLDTKKEIVFEKFSNGRINTEQLIKMFDNVPTINYVNSGVRNYIAHNAKRLYNDENYNINQRQTKALIEVYFVVGLNHENEYKNLGELLKHCINWIGNNFTISEEDAQSNYKLIDSKLFWETYHRNI